MNPTVGNPLPNPDIAEKINQIFARMTAADKLRKEKMEWEYDLALKEAENLASTGIVDAVLAAIAKKKKLRQKAAILLSHLAGFEEVQAKFPQWIQDEDLEWRWMFIQAIGSRRLHQFAPLLNLVITSDPSDQCRHGAIHAATLLKSPENLPLLIAEAEKTKKAMPFNLLHALSAYGSESCRPFLRTIFDDATQEKRSRIYAAWGLAKLKDAAAFHYLIEMLDDPDESTPKSYTPGQSVRAAQAICDVKGWPFEWGKTAVKNTKELLSSNPDKNLQ